MVWCAREQADFTVSTAMTLHKDYGWIHWADTRCGPGTWHTVTGYQLGPACRLANEDLRPITIPAAIYRRPRGGRR